MRPVAYKLPEWLLLSVELCCRLWTGIILYYLHEATIVAYPLKCWNLEYVTVKTM
jgi:hypothetical protein